MSERPEMITVSYVPGGTAEVHVSLPGSASNSARSSGPSAADVIFASSKLGPADPLFFYGGLEASTTGSDAEFAVGRRASISVFSRKPDVTA